MQQTQTQPGRSRRRHGTRLAAAALAVAAVLGLVALAGNAEAPREMPEFGTMEPGRWLNTEPLSRQDFRGSVVLIEIWTSV